MKEEIQVRISEEELIAKIKEIAQQINEDYVGKKVHLVCILSGSVFFTCELAKYITVPVTMDFMRVSSYGDGMDSTGTISIDQDLNMSIEGRHVLVVEDIVDSGRTLALLSNILKKRDPAVENGKYYVDENGIWDSSKIAKWQISNGRWWYSHADGSYTTNGWESIDGEWYYFDESGYMASSCWIGVYYVKENGKMAHSEWVDNGRYYVDENGVWVQGVAAY